MTEIERAAIWLHDYLWANMGVSDEWPIQMGGEDGAASNVITLMNELQEAIRKSPYPHKLYSPRDIP
jgi:hypothetical protein